MIVITTSTNRLDEQCLAIVDSGFKGKIPTNISSIYIDGKAVDVEDGFVLLFKMSSEIINSLQACKCIGMINKTSFQHLYYVNT